MTAAILFAGCQREAILPSGADQPGQTVYTGCIPQHTDGLPCLYLDTPEGTGIASKTDWTENCTVRIEASVNGVVSEVYSATGVKAKGRGNSTWTKYPKKPYTLKLKEQANFIGTGYTKRWVLLANWMDRTLLRNDVSFEVARRTTGLEWTPSGTFVDLYLNGNYVGCYWLGEKIHVEGSHFECDYLYSFDTSDKSEADFKTQDGHRNSGAVVGGIPVELKYPDRDNYPTIASFRSVLYQAREALYNIEDALVRGDDPFTFLDMDSFCDWYLVYEFCYNIEPKFPKSCFFYIKNGKLYAGPVWDFDYGTFTPDRHTLNMMSHIYYYLLYPKPEFKKHLKRRWKLLKPQLETLPDYVEERAAFIEESEARNHKMWPCFPNPLSENGTGMVNKDEKLTFREAVDRMKEIIVQRMEDMDAEIRAL